jgi:glycosyltransferase involved in cell wall biosynthesis
VLRGPDEGDVRIAFASEFPTADDRVVGGLEAVVRGLATTMSERFDHEVHAVSFHAGLETARVDVVGDVRVHRFPQPAHLGNLTFGAEERRMTARALRRIRPDVVHSLGLGPKALGTAASGLPWVVSVNGIQSNEARAVGGIRNRVRSWVCARMESSSLKAARHLIVPNPTVRGLLGGRIRTQIVHVIENSVDREFFEIGDARTPGTILSIGRVIPLKAPEVLIEASRLLAVRGIEARIRIVGPPDDDRYLAGLRARVRDAGLEGRVEFLGFVSDEELYREMAGAAVLAHASRVEVAPLSVMQAMAAGRPAVATDVGGTSFLVREGKTGFLVPPDSPGELAARLATLVEEPEVARRMGEAARVEAEKRFRITHAVERTLEVYEKAVAGHQATRD